MPAVGFLTWSAQSHPRQNISILIFKKRKQHFSFTKYVSTFLYHIQLWRCSTVVHVNFHWIHDIIKLRHKIYVNHQHWEQRTTRARQQWLKKTNNQQQQMQWKKKSITAILRPCLMVLRSLDRLSVFLRQRKSRSKKRAGLSTLIINEPGWPSLGMEIYVIIV